MKELKKETDIVSVCKPCPGRRLILYSTEKLLTEGRKRREYLAHTQDIFPVLLIMIILVVFHLMISFYSIHPLI